MCHARRRCTRFGLAPLPSRILALLPLRARGPSWQVDVIARHRTRTQQALEQQFTYLSTYHLLHTYLVVKLKARIDAGQVSLVDFV